MTDYDLYQVDAFTDKLFSGNPAAVMPLEAWLPDATLQAIAAENNLSETAYIVRREPGHYDLRWFTPGAEVRLCGHATLATAHILYTELGETADRLLFETRSGQLSVSRTQDGYEMDFPADPVTPADMPTHLVEALGDDPVGVFAGQYLMVVYEDAATVLGLTPNMLLLERVKMPRERGAAENCVCVTAPGEPGSGIDFVSRFFGPTVGITEDPVTGSAHCMLAPYWAGELGKETMAAYQASPRGGHVACTVAGDRVRLGGRAVTYLRGRISL